MGLLNHIHEKVKSGAKAPINPLISDGGAQLHTKSIFKAIDKALDKATDKCAFDEKNQGNPEVSDEDEK